MHGSLASLLAPLEGCCLSLWFFLEPWAASITSHPSSPPPPPSTLNPETLWMLVCTLLVWLMVPSLALFYGGMVRFKNILSTMMQCLACLTLVGVYWVVIGYNLAFGSSHGSLFGWSSDLFLLQGVTLTETLKGTRIPVLVHVLFHGMVAALAPAILSGALAERIRFRSYLLLVLAWVTFVYCPLAHAAWARDWFGTGPGERGTGLVHVGRLSSTEFGLGMVDFAGGAVVHLAVGIAGLAATLALRGRTGSPQQILNPNSMTLTLFSAGLLGFGWFGLTGGFTYGETARCVACLVNTHTAAMSAAMSWMIIEGWHRKKLTALGWVSGCVAGWVAIAPLADQASVGISLLIGGGAGGVCYAALWLKPRIRYDDALDAFGLHGVGAMFGLLAASAYHPHPWAQLLAVLIVVVFSFSISLGLVQLLDRLVRLRVEDEGEQLGLDRTEHGQVGFDLEPELAVHPQHVKREPRPAQAPPSTGTRFALIVEGVEPAELMCRWSELCQSGAEPPAPEFLEVYPHVTFVEANRFRFRGGEPWRVKEAMERLLRDVLRTASIRVRFENRGLPPASQAA